MKRFFFLLAFVSITLIGYGQQKVAVYAPEESNSGFDVQTKEFVIGEFVRVINQSNSYSAVNRSKEFEKGISSERSYQHSGLVDEKEISKLGRGSGASLVCVVVFRRVMGEKNIEARLIDVEREVVVVSDNRTIDYSNVSTLENDVKAMAGTLIQGRGSVMSINKRLMFDKDSKSLVSSYDRGSWDDLSKSQVLDRMKTCPEAYQLFNSGHAIRDGWRSAETYIAIFGTLAAGVGFFGWMLDEYKDEEGHLQGFNPDSKWLKIGVGALGVIIADIIVTECIAVPIGNSKIKKAVETYNNPNNHYSMMLRLGFTPTGVGLTLNF